MKAKLTLLLFAALAAVCFAQEDSAHKNELALGLGGLPALSRSDTPRLETGSGVAFQVNYGRRFFKDRKVALYAEIKALANPLRDVSSSIPMATRDFASLYITPGIRAKSLPTSRISLYALVGGGYGDYEQSTTRINGQPNSVSRELAHGVFDFGGGVDVHVWRCLALRGEARDFYSGSPAYNVAGVSGGQHNVVATGALVLGWH